MTASRNDTVNSEVPHAPFGAAQSAPLYFAVSPLKLVVMSVFTFGLYELYWFYKNWRLVTDREDPGLARAWNVLYSGARTFFAVFCCYSLFTRIQDSADEQEVPVSLACGFLAIGWIMTAVFAIPPLPLLSVVFLLPVQNAVNRINQTASPGHNANRRFSAWNIAVILIAAGLLAYAGYDALFADDIHDVD